MGRDDRFDVPHIQNMVRHAMVFRSIDDHELIEKWIVESIHGEFPKLTAGRDPVHDGRQVPRLVQSVLSIGNTVGGGIIPKQIRAQ